MIKRTSSWISDWYKGRVVLSGLTAIWNSTQEFLISFYTRVCTWPRPKISEYFPDEEPGETIVNIGLNGKALCFPLHGFSNASNRGFPVNRALSNMTSSLWYRVILVLRSNGTRRLGYSSAGENDLLHICTYFIEQHTSGLSIIWVLLSPSREGSPSDKIVDPSYVMHAQSCFLHS